MIKGYIRIIEATKKNGEPYKRIHFIVHSELTGEQFILFDTGMARNNNAKYETLLQTGHIKDIPPHDI